MSGISCSFCSPLFRKSARFFCNYVACSAALLLLKSRSIVESTSSQGCKDASQFIALWFNTQLLTCSSISRPSLVWIVFGARRHSRGSFQMTLICFQMIGNTKLLQSSFIVCWMLGIFGEAISSHQNAPMTWFVSQLGLLLCMQTNHLAKRLWPHVTSMVTSQHLLMLAKLLHLVSHKFAKPNPREASQSSSPVPRGQSAQRGHPKTITVAGGTSQPTATTQSVTTEFVDQHPSGKRSLTSVGSPTWARALTLPEAPAAGAQMILGKTLTQPEASRASLGQTLILPEATAASMSW